MRARERGLLAGFFLVLCLLVNSIPAHALELALESPAEVNVGDVFAVDLTIDAVTDLYGVALDLLYDSDLLQVVDAEPGTHGVQPDVLESTVLAEDGLYVTILRAALEDGEAGRLVLGLTRDGQVPGVVLTEKQILMTVYFEALAEGVANIDYDPDVCGLEDSTGEDIPIDTLIGTQVTIVQPCENGDINCDELINIFDLQLVINCILGSGSCDRCDLNGDTLYNIFDLQLVINKILGG